MLAGHYVVEPGDYLSKIAPRYGITWQQLYDENRSVIGDDPNLIYPGQVLATRHVDGSVEIRRAPAPDVEEPVHRSPLRPVAPHTEGDTNTPPPPVERGSLSSLASSVFGSGASCAVAIVERESGGNVHAANPVSGAYGLPQALPGSKMAAAGPDWHDNPLTQLRWLRMYADARYGGICAAWGFWQGHGWY